MKTLMVPQPFDFANYVFVLSDLLEGYMALLGSYARMKLKFIPGEEFRRSRVATPPDLRDSIHVAFARPSGEEPWKMELQPDWTEEQLVAYIVDGVQKASRRYKQQDGLSL